MENLNRIPFDLLQLKTETIPGDLARLTVYRAQGNDHPTSVAMLMADDSNDTKARFEELMEATFDMDRDISPLTDGSNREEVEFHATTFSISMFLLGFCVFLFSYLLAKQEALKDTTRPFIPFSKSAEAIHRFYDIVGFINSSDSSTRDQQETEAQASFIINSQILAHILQINPDPIQFIDQVIAHYAKLIPPESQNIVRQGISTGRERFINLYNTNPD